jgi:hypothetical protein
MNMDLNRYPVAPPKIVAIATDKYLTPEHDSVDKDLPGTPPKYGQDFTFGEGRTAPGGLSVGDSEDDRKAIMKKLLNVFALGDDTGMARRLFDKFLAKQKRVYYFEDKDLNTAAANHENIEHFCSAALGAPPPFGKSPAPGTTRIHQALKTAKWDVSKLVAPTDLGVPAFNEGSKFWGTGDFSNGLGLMINGVQHVYAIATHYHHDTASNIYGIKLKYMFYDVFGLDDDDLTEYGGEWTAAGRGITAWWQLQHQHGYAPLVTRIVVEKEHYVPCV